jgi:hypothetical protein
MRFLSPPSIITVVNWYCCPQKLSLTSSHLLDHTRVVWFYFLILRSHTILNNSEDKKFSHKYLWPTSITNNPDPTSRETAAPTEQCNSVHGTNFTSMTSARLYETDSCFPLGSFTVNWSKVQPVAAFLLVKLLPSQFCPSKLMHTVWYYRIHILFFAVTKYRR